MDDIEIVLELGKRKYIEDCIEISKICYGNEGITLNKLLGDSTDILYKDILVAINGEKVVGYIHFPIETVDKLDNRVYNILLEHGYDGLDYLCINSVCVLPEYRKKGIATLLIKKALEKVLDFNRDITVYAEVVQPPQKPMAATSKILSSLGFIEIGVVNDCWTEKSINNKLWCNDCGSICHCTAIIFVKNVHI